MTSFNVSWNSGQKAIGGKVFARKRRALNPDKHNVKSSSQNTIQKESNKLDNSSPKNHKTKKIPDVGTTADNQSNKLDKPIYQKPKKIPDVDTTTDDQANKLDKPIYGKPKQKFNRSKPWKVNTSLEKSSEIPEKWIKRKKKKDKLIVKQALQEGNAVPIQKSESDQWKHSLFSVGHKDVHIEPNRRGKSVVEKVFSAGKSFSNLEIHKYIVSNLEKIGFMTLTNVQEKSIPVVLSGQNVLVSIYVF